MNKRPIVGVMGSGADAYEAYAEPLGRLIAASGYNLLTGGGTGTMEAVSRSFTAQPHEGQCMGIIPTALNEAGIFAPLSGYPNSYVEVPIYTPLPNFKGEDPNQVSRNHVNIMTSQALVFLCGSKGTLNEYDLATRYNKPRICFGHPEDMKVFPAEARKTDNIDDVADFIREALHRQFSPPRGFAPQGTQP